MSSQSGSKIPAEAYAIIIGAMKCGTSSLYSYLVKHPQVCPSAVKEPEFFSKNQAHGHKVDRYEDLWEFDPNIHRIALEASTGYTKYASEPNVPETIHKYGVNPKMIYVVRDPFIRVVSHYNHARYKYDIGSDWNILDDHIVNVSNYYLQLEQFRKYFKKEQFLILDFVDIKNDPRSVLKQVFEFLGIPNVDVINDFSVHNKTNKMSKFQMFIKRNPGLRKPYLLIPQRVRNWGKKVFKKYSEPEKGRALTDQERSVIYDRLVDDMFKFQDEYGFDVAKWGFKR